MLLFYLPPLLYAIIVIYINSDVIFALNSCMSFREENKKKVYILVFYIYPCICALPSFLQTPSFT